ncbi:DUF1254 domain-containing protein [Vibrio maritimus]|uniref:DUF1254 domain-containing protein n=1 Tax=Vibrio maritimus TaxID=990268 RepID=UPI00406818C8
MTFKKSLITCSILGLGFALTACSTTSTETANQASSTIEITEQNYAHAETARNYRNWVALGANQQITHMRNLPPRGKDAPTVQMNDDTLYSVAVVEAVDGMVTFEIPESDVYMAVQVVNEGGHGEHYVVGEGSYTAAIETDYAFLIYRTGTEKGLEAARTAQDKIKTDTLKFGTYELQDYDYQEVEAWTSTLTAETQGQVFTYTFPRTSKEVTDLHQWNLENANGWGGSSPEVNVANLYTNSVMLDAEQCQTTSFEKPESKYFTSVTPYDESRYLIAGANHISSNDWVTNGDGTVTVSFNCGSNAINNIDTNGQDFSFTVRYYGVSQKVMNGEIAPEKTVIKS